MKYKMRFFATIAVVMIFGGSLVCCTTPDAAPVGPPVVDTLPGVDTLPIDTLPGDTTDSIPKPTPLMSELVVVNEGWFGHESGSVNIYNPNSGIFSSRVFAAANAGHTLGTTTQYGQLFGPNFYFVSKQGRALVACDARSMVRGGELEFNGENQGMAFAGVCSRWGVITTSDGAWCVGLAPLAMGAVVPMTAGGPTGGVMFAQDKLFVISRDMGLMIFAADTLATQPALTHVKQLEGVGVGFCRTPDGRVWCVQNDLTLLSIDPQSLDIKSYMLPDGVSVPSSWGSWNAGSLVADIHHNTVYFTASYTSDIYRLHQGDPSSAATPYIVGSKSEALYGAGLAVDPRSGYLVANLVNSSDYSDNRIAMFDTKNGNEVHSYKYTGFWFPAMTIFR